MWIFANKRLFYVFLKNILPKNLDKIRTFKLQYIKPATSLLNRLIILNTQFNYWKSHEKKNSTSGVNRLHFPAEPSLPDEWKTCKNSVY